MCFFFAKLEPFLVAFGGLAACEYMWALKTQKESCFESSGNKVLRNKPFAPHPVTHKCLFIVPQSQALGNKKSDTSHCGLWGSPAFGV